MNRLCSGYNNYFAKKQSNYQKKTVQSVTVLR